MSKKALIAEPDTDEARKQGAILSDDGYEVAIFGGSDLLEELAASSPDVLVLRHERPGQNGLALVQRIKKQQRFGGTAVVLTTSDLLPESIEQHKEQQYRADAYVRLPLRRQDLVEAARSLPEVVEAADVATEAEPSASDAGRPPPLPHNRPSPRVPGGRSSVGLSPDELSFFEDMFSSIQAVPENTPLQPEIPIPTSGPDRKLALLRTKLREYEHKMGRLKVAWTAREAEFRQAQSIVEQKGMEVEGLHLRIREVEEDLDLVRRQAAEKEAEWGRQIGEQWDERSLQEAELINKVAGKEHEVNKIERKLRKLEEEKDLLNKELSERIFEWEKAYKRFEEHHWAVIDSSEEEVERLERLLGERDARYRELRRQHVFVQSSLAVQRQRLDEAEGQLRRQDHARAEEVQRTGLFWWKAYQLERSLRLSARDEQERLELCVVELEEALWRHSTLLSWLERSRREEVMQLSDLERQGTLELAKTRDELTLALRENEALTDRLSGELALGEAAIHKLFFDNETQRIIASAQQAVRDERITELAEEEERLNEALREVTERLGLEEAHHAEERDRADDLERGLEEALAESASNSERSALEISSLSAERDRLASDLEEKKGALSRTREELEAERKARQAEQQEATLALERKETELRERSARAIDLERDLESARDDIQQLRGTVATRDERISELLARVRENDEAIVRLEAQGDRLTTTVAEQRADIEARAEREATLEEKLHAEEREVERLEGLAHQLENQLRESEQSHQRSETQLADVREALESERSAHAGTRGELEERDSELSNERELSAELNRELGAARAEVDAGTLLGEELQAEVRTLQERGSELRAALEERDNSLAEQRSQLADLERRGADLEADLEGARGRASELDAGLQAEQAAHGASREKHDELHRLYEALVETYRHAEGRVHELENETEDLAGRLSDQRELTESRERELAEVREGRDQLQALREKLQAKLDTADHLATDLEEQLSELSSQNGSLTETVAEQQRSLTQLDQELAATHARADEGERKASALSEEAQAQSARLEEQASRLREQEAELSELRSTSEDQRLAIEERARWVEAREARISELTAALEEEQRGRGEASERADEAAQRASELQEEVAGLRGALEAEQKQGQAALLGAQGSLEEERARAAALKGRLAEVEQRAQAAGEELARLSPLEAELAEARERAQVFEDQVRRLMSEQGEFSEQTASLETQLVEAQRQGQAAKGAEERLRAELAEAQAANARHEAAAREAQQKAELGARRLQEAQQLLARMKQSHEAGQARLGEVERRLESVEEQHKRQLEQGAEAHEAEKVRLAQELAKAKKGQRDALLKAQQIQQQYAAFKQQRDARLKAQSEALKQAAGKAPAAAAKPAPEPPAAAAPPAPAAPAPAEAPVPAPPVAAEEEDSFDSAFDEATRQAPPPVSGEGGAIMPSPDPVGDAGLAPPEDDDEFDEATRVVTEPGAYMPSKPEG